MQIGLGYDIEKMLDPVYLDIKIIIEMQYHTYPTLRDLTTEIALKSVEFISALFRWIDDTYKSFLAGGKIKEDVWWITTRFIRYIFQDYLAPAHSTAANTSFSSKSQRRNTLIRG